GATDVEGESVESCDCELRRQRVPGFAVAIALMQQQQSGTRPARHKVGSLQWSTVGGLQIDTAWRGRILCRSSETKHARQKKQCSDYLHLISPKSMAFRWELQPDTPSTLYKVVSNHFAVLHHESDPLEFRYVG